MLSGDDQPFSSHSPQKYGYRDSDQQLNGFPFSSAQLHPITPFKIQINWPVSSVPGWLHEIGNTGPPGSSSNMLGWFREICIFLWNHICGTYWSYYIQVRPIYTRMQGLSTVDWISWEQIIHLLWAKQALRHIVSKFRDEWLVMNMRKFRDMITASRSDTSSSYADFWSQGIDDIWQNWCATMYGVLTQPWISV